MTAWTAPRWTSVLDSVVVYSQGALCRRLARGAVPAGGHVRVTGLPGSLNPDSVRARVVNAQGVRVTEARVEVEVTRAPGRRSGLVHEVERLREACAAAQGRRDRQLALIKEVSELRPVPPARTEDDSHRRTPVDAWLNLSAFVDDRLTGLHSRLRALEKERRLLEHDLSVAEDMLSRASTATPSELFRTSLSAILTFDGTPEAGTEVEVEYEVPGAVWVPAYRLTHRQGEETGHLLLRASVAQRTGEDWTGVRIALSTADLRRGTDLPRLRSIRIGRSQPAPASPGWRDHPADLSDLFADYDAAGLRPGAGPPSAMPGTAPVPPPSELLGHSGPPLPADAGGYMAEYGSVDGSPTAASPPRPSGRPRRAAKGAASPAQMGPSAPAGAQPSGMFGAASPAPAAGPPQPDIAELDYGALVLNGPDAQYDRRGRLFPGAHPDPVTDEYRRRAETVARLPLPRHTVRPRTSTGSFDHRFDATARADVPSDGTWHSVTIGEVPIGVRTEYLCVPSVEQSAYTTLVLSNPSEQALPAGPVEVTGDEDFLLTASLPTLAPGGECRMGLGPAEAIGVTRSAHVHESTSGLRNNVSVVDHRVHVELANRLAVPVSVEVRERVPVTSDADVRIEEQADWVAPQDHGGERHAAGTRVWRVALPAGGTVSLDGGYEIRIPVGKALVGGNRRS